MRTRRVVILTDCQVLLDTVEQWTDEGPRPSLRNRPNGDLLDVLFRKLHAATASDILTVFVKIKAHRGDPANELADVSIDAHITIERLGVLKSGLRSSRRGCDASESSTCRRCWQCIIHLQQLGHAMGHSCGKSSIVDALSSSQD